MSTCHDTINQRVAFIGLDAEARARLRALQTHLAQAVPEALGNFYEKVFREPTTNSFFPKPGMVEQAKARQISHWSRLSSAEFDADYVKAVTRVGEVHARIGLEPRWYIAGYALILEQIIMSLKPAQTRRRFGQRRHAPDRLSDIAVLVKASLLDMDLSIAVYLEALDRRRTEIEEQAASTNRKVIDALGSALAALAEGDLSYRVTTELPETYAKLGEDFNTAVARLADSLTGIKKGTAEIDGGVDEIAQAAEDLARRTEQQASNLEQTTVALDEITSGIQTTADNAARADAAVTITSEAARKSHGIVGDAVTAMRQIETSSREIDQIIGLIDEVAFQTNLLALNAGVEAARAGDAGRGFAVVASEVRALAHRSAEAAKSIKALIARSSQQVGTGVKLVGETGGALETILENVSELQHLITDIASSAGQQASSLGEVNKAAGAMNQAVQQNAAMVEQTAAATHSLKEETAKLAAQVAGFRTRHDQPSTRTTTHSRTPPRSLSAHILEPV